MNKEQLKQRLEKDINMPLLKLLASQQTKSKHSNEMLGGDYRIFLANNLVYNFVTGYLELEYLTDNNELITIARTCCKGDEYDPDNIVKNLAIMFADVNAKFSFYRKPYTTLLRNCLKNNAKQMSNLLDFVTYFSDETRIVLDYIETKALVNLEKEYPLHLIRSGNLVYVAHVFSSNVKVIYSIRIDKLETPECFFEFLNEIACRMILPKYLNWSKL